MAAPVLLPTLATSGAWSRTRETEAPDAHIPRRDAIRALVPDATGNAADYVFVGSNDELRMDSPFLGVTALLLAGAAFGGVRRDRARGRLLLAGGAVGRRRPGATAPFPTRSSTRSSRATTGSAPAPAGCSCCPRSPSPWPPWASRTSWPGCAGPAWPWR